MQNIDGDHNIVRLVGICTESTPYLMVMELMARGDLKTVLRDSRPKAKAPSTFSLSRLAQIAACVAEGKLGQGVGLRGRRGDLGLG